MLAGALNQKPLSVLRGEQVVPITLLQHRFVKSYKDGDVEG